ncbi:PREDICTED: SNF2 domain-containing protein CLASSY 3-like isoform X2 [Ipomoea nil]|uniref:SNF2 domain-containing protein CLASSY 3-like isoform X2 n=1 Tax=Ipomoea nil TaxID=35883 RepID=UPI00090157CE|nr:PREDICTED: SNF2 domain-containing protein CLASSY 3-like isoform X2 [Ipomoea nil]
MDGSRRIYTRNQWDKRWNEEKKRKLSQSCKNESSGFTGNGSSEHGSTSRMVGKIVGEKAGGSGSSGNGDNFSFMEGLNRNKKKRRIESENVVKEVEKNKKVKVKEKIVTEANNVSSEGEDEDEDAAGDEEFALQSILSEKTDNRAEESSKKVEAKAVLADNFSTDSGESRGSPLNEKNSDYDDDYFEFLEEYLAVPPSGKEKSKHGVEMNNEAVDDIKCGSDASESFALSSDSTENLEKWAEKKKMNEKGKRKAKLEIIDDDVSPKVEGLDNVNIKDGPAYRLRSRSVSKYEMKEKDPANVTNPLPPPKEDWGSETSSDDKKDDCCVRIHVNKDKKNVERPSKRRKGKHGLGELNFKKILLNSILKDVDITKNNLQFCNENIPGQLPLKFRFEDEVPTPPEKMEWEIEIDSLFVDLQTGLQEDKDSLTTTQPSVNEDNISAEKHDDSAVCCEKGNHFIILDEQIGLICKYCSFVSLEMKYILPEFAKKTGRRQGMRFYDDLDCPLNGDNLPLDGASGNHCNSIHGGTTVWDILPPGTKGTMYPHQREGFEFLWRNIGGDIHIENLKKLQSDCGKGCIISHAPGTGKTRLTIVFLQSFMKLFPDSHPVIIAPRSMLLTWEAEFRKWDVDIPFHNVNNPALSGRENSISHNFLNEFKNTESKRLLKVYSWAEGSGILGITYRLFEQCVRVKENKEDDKLRKILLQVPGLVVLDEGHTPRNDESLIWKALSKLETPRRIILSGTPFQNNFDELYNTLCLVSPKFSDFSSGSPLKHMRRTKAAKKKWDRLTSSIGKNKNDAIKELKRIIAPLVHVHNGSVLQERLPGVRSTLVYLKPTSWQKKLFSAIPQKKLFEEDHVMTRISVHPSLAKDIPEFSEYRSEMKKLELNPDAGVKTEFLFALICLSVSHGEKVIVFSQYIAPMELIKKQLKSVFDWVEGREVLHMDGEIDVHHRQASINTLNDPKSEVKVLLASTRACCEGINLVGASRVVLLDVVWNPSVKRQAISRAYRLGQKKIVHVYHLISSTMEARKFACQRKKDFISELVFSTSDGLPCEKGLPVSEDKILEAMVQHPKHRHIFDRLYHDPKVSDLIDTFNFVE